jgi:hypothetical protein
MHHLQSEQNPREAVLSCLVERANGILVHGFGKLYFSVEMVKDQKRAATVECGKSYKFTVPVEFIPPRT